MLTTSRGMRSCLGNQSSGILERCPRKQRQLCERMDDIFCCFAILHLEHGGMALLLPDWDTQDDPKTMDHKGLKAANMRLKEGSALQTIQQGWKDDVFRMRTLVLIWIFGWYHKMWDSEWNTDEALHIRELTSASIPQSFWTVLPRYWKWDTNSIGSHPGTNWMGVWLWAPGFVSTASVLVF